MLLTIGIFLLCSSLLLSVKLYYTTKYNKILFTRSWKLERFLMDIYNDVPPKIQERIERELNSIQPL